MFSVAGNRLYFTVEAAIGGRSPEGFFPFHGGHEGYFQSIPGPIGNPVRSFSR